MSVIAKQSTARSVIVGPILDADGVAVTDAVVGDLKISKNGANPAALNGSAALTHRATGHYSLDLTTSDTDTVGQAEIVIDDTTNAMPVKVITIVEEAVYDALFAVSAAGFSTHSATDVWSAGTRTITGTVTVGTNNDKTGYSLSTAPLDAAGIRTAVGLASANLDTQLAAIPTAAEINTEVDTALADYDAPTKAELDAAVGGLNDLDAAGIRAAIGMASADLDTQLDGISGLDAAGVRAAVGLASANLDTQLSGLDTAISAIDTGTGAGATKRLNTGNAYTVSGSPVANVVVKVFSDSGRTTLVAQDVTGADGLLNTGVYLDPGTYYTRAILSGHAVQDDVIVATGTTETLSYNP